MTRLSVIFLLLAVPPATSWRPEFHNVASQSGLVHSFPNGGAEFKSYIPETTGSGIALIDYDNDGFLDIFVVSGPGGSNRLYRNDGKGGFEDVTVKVGLERSG